MLAGYLSIGILVVCTDLILGKLFPSAYVHGKMPPDHLLAVSLATATAYSVAGGWITARLAARKHWLHVFGLIAFGEMMGLASMIAFWGQQPLWYALSLLVLYPPAVWLGGRLWLGGTIRPTGTAPVLPPAR